MRQAIIQKMDTGPKLYTPSAALPSIRKPETMDWRPAAA